MSADRRTRILDVAQRLVQESGHLGFSFRDLSREVGIRTASIHYHFPTKTDLAVALVRRYRQAISGAMSEISAEQESLADRLPATVRLYADTLNNGSRICVCAALAGDYSSLPSEVQSELKELVTESERWLDRFFSEGRARGEIPRGSDPQALARLWYATLQGALLIARASNAETLDVAATALTKLTLTPHPV